MIDAVGVSRCKEPDKPSGEVEEWVRAGTLVRGDAEVNPPSMKFEMSRGWMDCVVLLCAWERAVSSCVICAVVSSGLLWCQVECVTLTYSIMELFSRREY
jgi:hypothetical protein